jgi:curli biogenesis system outer membrane secretion channel CsgG
MKTVILALTFASLAGCGVETATTAVTGAAIKKQELEQGKQTMEQAQQKIDQATQQMQRAQTETEAASK